MSGATALAEGEEPALHGSVEVGGELEEAGNHVEWVLFVGVSSGLVRKFNVRQFLDVSFPVRGVFFRGAADRTLGPFAPRLSRVILLVSFVCVVCLVFVIIFFVGGLVVERGTV